MEIKCMAHYINSNDLKIRYAYVADGKQTKAIAIDWINWYNDLCGTDYKLLRIARKKMVVKNTIKYENEIAIDSLSIINKPKSVSPEFMILIDEAFYGTPAMKEMQFSKSENGKYLTVTVDENVGVFDMDVLRSFLENDDENYIYGPNLVDELEEE
jgi:hypothetical protein